MEHWVLVRLKALSLSTIITPSAYNYALYKTLIYMTLTKWNSIFYLSTKFIGLAVQLQLVDKLSRLTREIWAHNMTLQLSPVIKCYDTLNYRVAPFIMHLLLNWLCNYYRNNISLVGHNSTNQMQGNTFRRLRKIWYNFYLQEKGISYGADSRIQVTWLVSQYYL